MKTAGDLLKEVNQPATPLPFFTREGWMLLGALAVIGGIIGATIYLMILTPFLR